MYLLRMLLSYIRFRANKIPSLMTILSKFCVLRKVTMTQIVSNQLQYARHVSMYNIRTDMYPHGIQYHFTLVQIVNER